MEDEAGFTTHYKDTKTSSCQAVASPLPGFPELKQSFVERTPLVIENILFQQTKSPLYIWTWPDGQYLNQIDYVLTGKNGEALYSEQKQDLEMTMAQIMSSLLKNSGLN